ncbi:MAG: hypothetical protein ACRCSG_03235 [Cellulosilyticaceae bacterium]
MKKRENWTYLLIGIGCGFVVSGIFMVVISLKIGQEVEHINNINKQEIQKLSNQLINLEKEILEKEKLQEKEIQEKELQEKVENTNKNNLDEQISDAQTEEKEKIKVVIPSYYDSVQITKYLEKNGIVEDGEKLHEMIKEQKKTTKLRTGTLYFNENASNSEVLDVLLGKNN